MSPIRPTDTAEGQLWLGNFAPEDAPQAAMLLDSLHFISEDSFRAGLIDLLCSIITEVPEDTPITLYPVRPPPREVGYTEPNPERPWVADDGSEHIVANILREVVNIFSTDDLVTRRPISALETLDDLRNRRVRRVIIVDDYLGSGTSILRYLNSWWANPSIKSWRSFGLIEFTVASYACTTRARQLVEQHKLLDGLRWVEYGLDFSSAQWTEEERTGIRELCLKYAIKKSLALGYKKSEGLLVMNHTVPNNLPHIFRAGSGPNGLWKGFFPSGARRISPRQQLQLSDYRPEFDFTTLARRLNHPRLAEGFLREDARTRPLLLLLAALSRSLRSDERLILDLGLTIFEFRSLIETAEALELVDARRHLTDQGRAALHHAGLRARDVRFRLQGSADLYYPRTLRGNP